MARRAGAIGAPAAVRPPLHPAGLGSSWAGGGGGCWLHGPHGTCFWHRPLPLGGLPTLRSCPVGPPAPCTACLQKLPSTCPLPPGHPVPVLTAAGPSGDSAGAAAAAAIQGTLQGLSCRTRPTPRGSGPPSHRADPDLSGPTPWRGPRLRPPAAPHEPVPGQAPLHRLTDRGPSCCCTWSGGGRAPRPSWGPRAGAGLRMRPL